jgi:hypothetical protein
MYGGTRIVGMDDDKRPIIKGCSIYRTPYKMGLRILSKIAAVKT